MIHDNHITSSKLFHYKTQADADAGKNGYLYEEYAYDANGNQTDYKFYKKNGKVKYHYSYKWNDEGKSTEFQWLKKDGSMKMKNTTAYNGAGKVIEEKQFWKSDNDLAWHSTSTYDAQQNLIGLKYLLNNDKKLYRRYAYSYYPDGSKKQTIEYNRKDVVKHIWNYDCNPAGSLETKSLKDSSKICIRYETDKDGNQIKIKEQNVKQGKTVRIITKYDIHDNEIYSVGYKASGKETRHVESSYDNRDNLTERKLFKPNTAELKNRWVVHYDNSGNVTESKAYKGSELTHFWKYSYTKS